jgi:hypothetical protein
VTGEGEAGKGHGGSSDEQDVDRGAAGPLADPGSADRLQCIGWCLNRA